MVWQKYLRCKNRAHSFENLQKVQKGQVGMSLSSVSWDVHVLVESFTSYAVLHVKQSFVTYLLGTYLPATVPGACGHRVPAGRSLMPSARDR